MPPSPPFTSPGPNPGSVDGNGIDGNAIPSPPSPSSTLDGWGSDSVGSNGKPSKVVASAAPAFGSTFHQYKGFQSVGAGAGAGGGGGGFGATSNTGFAGGIGGGGVFGAGAGAGAGASSGDIFQGKSKVVSSFLSLHEIKIYHLFLQHLTSLDFACLRRTLHLHILFSYSTCTG